MACPKGHNPGMAEKLAEIGWFLRLETVDAASKPAVMYFAVGKNSSQDAIAAVLDYPGIEPGDEVTWADQLPNLRPARLKTQTGLLAVNK